MGLDMWHVWLIASIVFFIIEAITLGLTTIWFGVGSICAMVSALLDLGIYIQIGVFLITSILSLMLTRKIFVDRLKTGTAKTNLDAIIGKSGIVDADIAPLKPGLVKIWGQSWTAATRCDDVIVKGSKVKVIAVEGVKIIVEKI
ncbi:NfeD family protein [Eubacteriales bacterium KG127]